jgi:hypothetical protein
MGSGLNGSIDDEKGMSAAQSSNELANLKKHS